MKAKTKRTAADALVTGYAMQKNGPEVNPSDVELEHVASLEVGISWGDNVLHVEHLTPPRTFQLGEGGDFEVAGAALGASTMPLVVVEGGVPAIVLPPGASGQIDTVGAMPQRIADLIAAGQARPYIDPKGILQDAKALDLPAGSQATVRYAGSDLTFRVASVCAGRPVPVDIFTPASGDAIKFVAASFIAHASMLGAMAFFMPGLGATDAESLDTTNVLMMQKLLSASADRELEQERANGAANDETSAPSPKGDEGSRAKLDEGKAGAKDTASTTPARYGLERTRPGDPELARQAAIKEAQTFGFVATLAAMAPDAPAAPWGADIPNGNDAKNAQGSLMFGTNIDDMAGAGGLRLDGAGEGGGGQGDLIALDGIHGLGNGGKPWGNCSGAHCGSGGNGPDGMGKGGPGSDMRPHVPTVKQPRTITTDIGGRIDREVIQRIVRMNFGRFRACYEEGLRTNPSLTGRVEVKFIIGRDGSVATAQDGGSDLPDQKVVQCVVRNFGPLSFPQPTGGTVGVTYPLVFSPSD